MPLVENVTQTGDVTVQIIGWKASNETQKTERETNRIIGFRVAVMTEIWKHFRDKFRGMFGKITLSFTALKNCSSEKFSCRTCLLEQRCRKLYRMSTVSTLRK